MKDYVAKTWGWDEDFQARYFREHFNPSGTQIIQVGGADAGMPSLKVRPSELYLDEIQIAPPQQRQGVGTAIIGDLLARARADGAPLALQVLKVNPARRLYERLGFVVTGETGTHYLMRADPVPTCWAS